MPKRKDRPSPQKTLSVPSGDWARIEAAMKYDGISNFSQFALASIRQRVARIEQQMARDKKEHDRQASD